MQKSSAYFIFLNFHSCPGANKSLHATISNGGLSPKYLVPTASNYTICQQSLSNVFCVDKTVYETEYEALNDSISNALLFPYGCIMRCKATGNVVNSNFLLETV